MVKKIEIGDAFIVEMLPNKKKRNLPICRCDGRISFLNSKTKEKILVGETWLVSVLEVHDAILIVEPCFLEMSLAETEKYKLDLLSVLIPTERIKRKKVKKTFQYLSKNEMQ